jgi:hypothetical protein
MKAKLIRTKDSYHLWLNPETKEQEHIASINPILNDNGFDLRKFKLSKQNCDEIFGVVDVEELSMKNDKGIYRSVDGVISYRQGFNKAMELNKDKVFTFEDVMNCWNKALKFQEHKETLGEYIQSFQQPTEIEVMIEMGKVVDETKVIGAVKSVKGSGHKITTYKSVPKLDSSGQLILKKI